MVFGVVYAKTNSSSSSTVHLLLRETVKTRSLFIRDHCSSSSPSLTNLHLLSRTHSLSHELRFQFISELAKLGFRFISEIAIPSRFRSIQENRFVRFRLENEDSESEED
ncbi:hypothetical protein L195_g004004 [Trifolium pratense]|uniref:Uncharacterized protein n=1 Tax=Trifolium pratense TaxID=57577 RepID=A0A2K3MBB5_TRIPR|nr:hypothetical protein L195_g044169 [Trifolium pratense]PNY07506.1 hypothetical protein L195_g004004 [Trifolium pratense]